MMQLDRRVGIGNVPYPVARFLDIFMLDSTDLRIISLLQQDGDLSISNLADLLGMTAPPCWRRVKALKEKGVLKRKLWEVDPHKINLHVCIFATVKLAAHDLAATTAFQEEVQKFPEILECYILLGSIDVLLKIMTPSIEYYETFFYEHLSQLPAVREVTSSVVMSEVKKMHALPLLGDKPTGSNAGALR
jgi:Lrp/AsnC family transcriptional regulator